MREAARKKINWLIEVVAKREMGEVRREGMFWEGWRLTRRGDEVGSIQWLVELITKGEVSDEGRKVVYGLVERIPKFQMKNVWRKVLDWIVEFLGKVKWVREKGRTGRG